MANLFDELKRRNVIRVAVVYIAGSWLLIQVLETLLPIFGLAETSIRIVVIVLAVLFAPALAVAWAFELTPEGLRLDSEVATEAPSRPRTHKLLDRVIMMTLALAVSYFAFDKFVLDPAEDVEIAEKAAEQARSEALLGSYGEKSIAVLAFVDMSPEGDQEYFSDGIAEELLNLLARVPELRVAGRTSAFSFKGSDATIADIGEQLNVAHVLEGSVRMFGDKIRITAQLVEASTDTHLWSETYDREMGDIFVIQDDIAARVVEQLKMTLLEPLARAAEVDPEAHALVLQARYLFNRDANNEDGERIVSLLKQALDRDPDYLEALTLLYWVYRPMSDAPQDEIAQLMDDTLERARAIDPDHPHVLVVEAWQAMGRGDYVPASRLVERAVAEQPTDHDVAVVAIWFARFMGMSDLAIQIGEFVVSRDPLCNECQITLAHAYRNAGRYEEALARMQVIDALWGIRPVYVAYVQLLKGEPEAVLESLEQTDDEADQLLIAMALHDLGSTEEALALLESLEERFGEEAPIDLAAAYAWIGDADKAFQLWERGVNDESESEPSRQIYVTIEATNPVYAKLHDDPRWQPFIDQYGVPPEQLAAIDIEFNLPGSRGTAEP